MNKLTKLRSGLLVPITPKPPKEPKRLPYKSHFIFYGATTRELSGRLEYMMFDGAVIESVWMNHPNTPIVGRWCIAYYHDREFEFEVLT